MIRHLNVLMSLAECGRPLGAQDVSKLTGMPRASAYKVLEELVADGWLIADGSPRRFRPSLKVVQLGARALAPLRARRVMIPHSIDCARTFDKRCSIAFYEAGDVVYTDGFQRVGDNVVPFALSARVHCLTTASGKVLLAFQSESEIRRVVCAQSAPHRIDGPDPEADEILEELRGIRAAGYGVADGEYDARSRGVAVPVFSQDGTVAAAMGVDALSGLTPTFVESVLAPLSAAASRASLELGYMDERGHLA